MLCMSSSARRLQACRLHLYPTFPPDSTSLRKGVAEREGGRSRCVCPPPPEPPRRSVTVPAGSDRPLSAALSAARWRLWWVWFCFPCAHIAFAAAATRSPQTTPSLPSGGGQNQRRGRLGCPRPGLGEKLSILLPHPSKFNYFNFFLAARLAPSPELGTLGAPRQVPSHLSVLGGPRGARGPRDAAGGRLRLPPRNFASRLALVLPVPPAGSCRSCLPALGSFGEKHRHPKRFNPPPPPLSASSSPSEGGPGTDPLLVQGRKSLGRAPGREAGRGAGLKGAAAPRCTRRWMRGSPGAVGEVFLRVPAFQRGRKASKAAAFPPPRSGKLPLNRKRLRGEQKIPLVMSSIFGGVSPRRPLSHISGCRRGCPHLGAVPGPAGSGWALPGLLGFGCAGPTFVQENVTGI